MDFSLKIKKELKSDKVEDNSIINDLLTQYN